LDPNLNSRHITQETFGEPILRGIKIDPFHPFHLQFVIEKRQKDLSSEAVRFAYARLAEYFLAALTIPVEDLWVNLSPFEAQRIIDPTFGQTQMGKVFLEEDCFLKQISAALTNPKIDSGKKFWQAINPSGKVNTFNKVWIVPGKVTIYQDKQAAFITRADLTVLTDKDYLATSIAAGKENQSLEETASQKAFRQHIVPLIEKEVNQGSSFGPLRQAHNALLLALWFKQRLRNNIVNLVYSQQRKVKGVDTADKAIVEKVYAQYLELFKKGVYDFIDKTAGEPRYGRFLPSKVSSRRYFSGGLDESAAEEELVAGAKPLGELPSDQGDYAAVDVGLSPEGNVEGADYSKGAEQDFAPQGVEADIPEAPDPDDLSQGVTGNIFFHSRYGVVKVVAEDQKELKLEPLWMHNRQNAQGARYIIPAQDKSKLIPYVNPRNQPPSPELAKALEQFFRTNYYVPELVPYFLGLRVLAQRMYDYNKYDKARIEYYWKIFDELIAAFPALRQGHLKKIIVDFSYLKHNLTVFDRFADFRQRMEEYKKLLTALFVRILRETGEDVVLTGFLDSCGHGEGRGWSFQRLEQLGVNGGGKSQAYWDRGRIPSAVDSYIRAPFMRGLLALNQNGQEVIASDEYQQIVRQHNFYLAIYFPKEHPLHSEDRFSPLILEQKRDFTKTAEILPLVRERLQELGRGPLAQVDLVVPAPNTLELTNQTIPLAGAVAKELNKPYCEDGLAQVHKRFHQPHLPPMWRRANNAGGVFTGDKERLAGKIVLIVDDNDTTGFTAAAMRAAALAAGAKEAYVLCYGKTVSGEIANLPQEIERQMRIASAVDTGAENIDALLLTPDKLAQRFIEQCRGEKPDPQQRRAFYTVLRAKLNGYYTQLSDDIITRLLAVIKEDFLWAQKLGEENARMDQQRAMGLFFSLPSTRVDRAVFLGQLWDDPDINLRSVAYLLQIVSNWDETAKRDFLGPRLIRLIKDMRQGKHVDQRGFVKREIIKDVSPEERLLTMMNMRGERPQPGLDELCVAAAALVNLAREAQAVGKPLEGLADLAQYLRDSVPKRGGARAKFQEVLGTLADALERLAQGHDPEVSGGIDFTLIERRLAWDRADGTQPAWLYCYDLEYLEKNLTGMKAEVGMIKPINQPKDFLLSTR
jgi:hypothetical protein